MSVIPEPTASADITPMVENTVLRGQKYAKAFLEIDPRLAEISPKDWALAINVGEGPEVVALKEMGFGNIKITNDPDAEMGMIMDLTGSREDEILNRVIKDHSPPDTYFSNLEIFDLFKSDDRAPRLATMLHMSPRQFRGDDPGYYLRMASDLHENMRENSTFILSARSDHGSREAFISASEHLKKQGVGHALYMDDTVPPTLTELGQRILVIKK